MNAEVLGKSTDLPAPKALVPSVQGVPRVPRVPHSQVGLRHSCGRRQGWGDTCAFSTSAFGSSNPVGVAGPPGAGSPIPMEVLAGHGVEAAAEEAARPSARESLRISTATEILETEDDTPSEEEEVQSMRGTPTGVLYEQVVPLLRYLDRKATKYGDPRQCGTYVELIRNQTRIKVATNPELMSLDQKYRHME